MRISKPPEERKQEIIDTAMYIFAEKGYEATTVSDIAKRMNVASGLFYKYFPSKEKLYHIALDQYAQQFSKLVISALKKDYTTKEEIYSMIEENLAMDVSKQKYHKFFHGKGNELFHQQLNYIIAIQIIPQATIFIEKMIFKFKLELVDAKSTAQFLVFGIMAIVNDESESINKSKVVTELLKKIFQ